MSLKTGSTRGHKCVICILERTFDLFHLLRIFLFAVGIFFGRKFHGHRKSASGLLEGR